MAFFIYPPVSVTTTLPAGASTEAKQDSQITELQQIEALLTTVDADTSVIATDTTSIDGKITAVDTGNVTIAASALPTGASTAANQTTANASLSSMEADLDALNARLPSGLIPEKFDEVTITYVGATEDINTVAFKEAAVTVATLTFSYDGSNRLTGVVKS